MIAVAHQIFFSFVLATAWFIAYIECVAHPSKLLSRPAGNLQYVPRLARQAMEMGQIMPDVANEQGGGADGHLR